MQKCLQRILLFIAVITVAGHSIIPHFHHQAEQAVEKHHHDNEEDDHHGIFSFAQLDEDFVPAKLQLSGLELPVIYLLTPVISFHLEIIANNSKTHFGCYREFPPPNSYLSKLPARAPPLLIAA
jgi:hypothetical protein